MFQSAKLTLYYYKTSICATYFRQLAFLGKKYGEKEAIGSFFRQKGVVCGLKGLTLGRIDPQKGLDSRLGHKKKLRLRTNGEDFETRLSEARRRGSSGACGGAEHCAGQEIRPRGSERQDEYRRYRRRRRRDRTGASAASTPENRCFFVSCRPLLTDTGPLGPA